MQNIGSSSKDPSFSGRRCFRARLSGIFTKPSHWGHAQHCTFSTSLPIHYPPRPHVLFCPLCIPQLSLGANLLVETFWLHLPFKSYRLKLDISSLSCSWMPGIHEIAFLLLWWALWLNSLSHPLKYCDWVDAADASLVTEIRFPRICPFVSSWLPDFYFIVRWQCQKPLRSPSVFTVFIIFKMLEMLQMIWSLHSNLWSKMLAYSICFLKFHFIKRNNIIQSTIHTRFNMV